MSSSVKAPAQSLPPTPMTVAGDYRLSRIRELQQTYSATQKDLARLEERIELLHALVAEEAVHALADPDRNATLARHQYDLGVGLYEHFMHVRDFSNLTAAEAHLRSALYRLPLGASSLEPGYALGAVLRERASGSHSILLVEEALVLHRQPFAFNFNLSNMERAHNSRELGLTLRVHYAETGTQQSLKEGAQQLKVAHALFTDAGVADHACSAGLVLALVELYDLHSDKAHLSEASSIGDLALMQCRSAHRDFYNVVSSVSKMRRILAWYCDDVAALLSALDILRVALEDAPLGWATPLTIQLVTVLRAQFVKHGREEDLLEATAWVTTLLDRLSPGASRWEQLQASLAYILWLRFTISGQADVIEQAAHTIELALTKVNAGTPDYFHYMTLLATCREAQYSAFGDIDHLNQCITLNREASRSTPLHSIDHMVAQHNFMCALKIRAEATDSLYDLNEAIELAPDSHSIQTADPTNAPTMLLDIGSAFLLRFEITGSLDDLERATTNHREAAQAWTSNSSQGFAYHNVLSAYAKVLRIRYEVLDEKESVEKALVQQKQLVDVVPTAHADRSRVLCGLAQTLTSLYLGQDDLEKALDLLLDALHNAYCPAYRRLKDVMDVLRSLATSAPQLSQENALKLSVVYSTAIALLPQVASFGLDPRTRLSVISGSGQLTTQAASHAISIGQYELALEMLEAGRSVFWTQGLHLRTPFTDLPPAISDRLKNITSALGQPMPDSSAEGPAKDRELARRRRLGDDFTAVLAEARLLPGFEGLLQNISFSSLARASQQHPIVVLVAGENIAHALIILEDARCIHVTLEKAASGSLKTLSDRVEAHSQHVRSRGVRKVQTTKARPTDVYRELWALVMLPIVTALGWSKAQGRSRRRLTLCPTGVFMQLPLHAAGIYTGSDQVCCSDYFVSTYVPSIGALLHAQQTFQPVRRIDADTLIVAVENPFEGLSLPLTSKEASTVRHHVSPSTTVTEVSKSPDVSQHIRSASILHMACHGTQNLADALQSGFFLEDELLPVSKLMQLELPRAFLAVLSACETAKSDATQPDQAIHLAATMLYAGFKTVVATMWFMRDLEGPNVAESIYSTLFKDGGDSEFLDPEDVPYALDEAVGKLRDSGLDPSFWATYVHIGI